MMIKFKKSLSDYKYLLSFDLAKKLSGYSLLDINNDKVLFAGIINTEEMSSEDMVWDYFYNQIVEVINECFRKIGNDEIKYLLVTKEALPVQNGRFSTIATLQSLAQVHAIFDLAIFKMGVDIYDEIGVHSIAVKAYFRSLLDIQNPQKEDIANCLYQKYKDYDLNKFTLDVTDSIGVSLTLLHKKWNSDIQSEISNIKKEIKKSKLKNKIERLENKIQELESFKTDE